MTLQVYTWWQQPSEAEAFDAVREIHRRKHENVEVRKIGDLDSGETRQQLARGMLAEDPPASFLANAGADLLAWAAADLQGDPEEHVLTDPEPTCFIHDVSDLVERTELRRNLRPGLRDYLVAKPGSDSTNTRFYGVPINVHRLNVVYYNRDAPTNFESSHGGKRLFDLETLCPQGTYDPWDREHDLKLDIVIGAGKQPFTIVLFALENVLPAVARRNRATAEATERFYHELLQGLEPEPRANGASSDVREAFRCVQYLSQWFRRELVDVPNDGTDELKWVLPSDVGWAKAVNDVAAESEFPEATAFTVMGDWANGLLIEQLGSGAVHSAAFPGTEDLFVFTSDTFPLPIGTTYLRETEDLLETIASTDAQIAFSAKKGSIPAREDARLDSLEDWQKETDRAFRTSRHLLANSGWFPPYYPQDDLQAALIAMIDWEVVRPGADPVERERRVEEALRVFTDLEPILKHWQDRLGRGAACPEP